MRADHPRATGAPHTALTMPPNSRCSWRRSYGTRGGTRFARVHRAILLDPPQLNAIRLAGAF